jgi:hypothetical protein
MKWRAVVADLLGTRITNIISVTHEALPDKDGVLLCACGAYFDTTAEHGIHVAGVLIDDLGLQRQSLNRVSCVGNKPASRYVTEWVADA